MRKMGIGLGVGINRSNYAQGIFSAYQSRVIADGGVTEAGACVDAVSGLLQSASLLLIPSGYKSGKAYAEIPTNGNGDLTWTRASDAFRTNASGLIQRVPWNLLQQSETFSNAYWNKTSATITADTTTAPNGTLTADTLTISSGGYLLRQDSYSVTTGLSMTISIYAKNQTSGFLTFGGATPSGTDSSSIIDVGNGWYRHIVTRTFTTTTTTGNVQFIIFNQVGTHYIWGAQLVEGTTAQTYLPTTDRLNFPRLSYMYGSCPAALLEPQRTNLQTQSNGFLSSWTNDNVTTSTGETTLISGQSTVLMTETTANGVHRVLSPLAVTLVSGSVYTISFYAKSNGTRNIALRTGISGTTVNVIFNPNTQTAVTVPSGFTTKITSANNGYYRYEITVTSAVVSDNISIVMFSGTDLVYTGTNQSIYISACQIEQGAYPTTYIPTTSATATRIADSFSRNNIYTNGLISASGGTWFVELRNNVAYVRDGSGFIGIGDTSALTTNSLVIFCPSTSSRLQIAKFIATVGTTLYTTTTDTVKIAVKWNGTSADVFANGTKVVSATSFTTTLMEFLQSSIQVPTFIQQMALHPEPLTDAKLIELTTL